MKSSFNIISVILVIVIAFSIVTALSLSSAAENEETWTRVTSVEELLTGGKFIIGYESDPTKQGKIVPMTNFGTANVGTFGFMFSGAEASQGNNKTIDMNDVSGAMSEYAVTIGESSACKGCIFIKTPGGYIGNGDNTKNKSALYAEDSLANGTSLSVSVGENDVFSISNDNDTYCNFRYNPSSPRFAFYSSSQKDLVIYKSSKSSTDPQPPVSSEPTDTDIPTVDPEYTKPASGKQYNLVSRQKNIGKVLYFDGKLTDNTFYLSTTEDQKKAVVCYISERQDGGYDFFFLDGAEKEKKYIVVKERKTGANAGISAKPDCKWEYDDTVGTLVTKLGNDYYFIATYNTYEALGVKKLSSVSGANAATLDSSIHPARTVTTEPAPTSDSLVYTTAFSVILLCFVAGSLIRRKKTDCAE